MRVSVWCARAASLYVLCEEGAAELAAFQSGDERAAFDTPAAPLRATALASASRPGAMQNACAVHKFCSLRCGDSLAAA